jgi:WD40 repeat protein
MSSPVVGRQETSTIKPHKKFEGHTDAVTGAIHLPDGQRMMTCSFDGSMRVWNLKSGKQIGEDLRDGDSKVWTVVSGRDESGYRKFGWWSEVVGHRHRQIDREMDGTYR